MSVPTQSTSPVTFMPALATYLRATLSLSTDQVKIVDSETFNKERNTTLLQKGIILTLDGIRPVLKDQGAGRAGFKVNRTLRVMPVTNSNLDPAGRNEIALLAHWTFEDSIVNALQLYKSTLTPPFIPHLLDASNPDFLLRYQNSKYTSVVPFELTYVLALDVTCTGT